MNAKDYFARDFDEHLKTPDVLVVIVELPSGIKETIINHTPENIEEKMNYYMENYDDDLCLKHNKNVSIIGWIFA